MKVSDLSGQALDYWVARCLNEKWYPPEAFAPSTNWAQGGPIIEREKINVTCLGLTCFDEEHWRAESWHYESWREANAKNVHRQDGLTPLVAAMRCFVAAKFGEEVPDENLP